MSKYGFLRVVAIVAAFWMGQEIYEKHRLAWLYVIPGFLLAEVLISTNQFKTLGYVSSNSGPKRREEGKFYLKMEWIVFVAALIAVSLVFYFG